VRIGHAIIIQIVVCAIVCPAFAQAPTEEVPLVSDNGTVNEAVLEALLAPGEFSNRRFVYVSIDEEAVFSLDSSLGATPPFAQLQPARLKWPPIAGLELRIDNAPLKLLPGEKPVTDDDLDKGFFVHWTLAPLGQRFDPDAHFAAKITAAKVISTADSSTMLTWQAEPSPSICTDTAPPGQPICDLPGISKEARALAISPDGKFIALALGGLQPRLEVYQVDRQPKLAWRAVFSTKSGGVVETAFSEDGNWIVALTGRGRMHRFEAKSGGRHMSVPSKGRTARSIPPGRMMAVAGEAGEVKLWYLADGTIAWRLPGRKLRGPIDKLATSGNGQRFATLEYDEASTVVRIWEINDRSMLAQIEVDPYAVFDIALDATGETLFVAHEDKGLLKAHVEKGAIPTPLGTEVAARCRGRIQWITALDLLICSVKQGVIQIDHKGRQTKYLKTNILASSWIAAAASGGQRLAAVGDGHLLIWQIE
jgi:hypothetical protein